jgi:hypothetical protein
VIEAEDVLAYETLLAMVVVVMTFAHASFLLTAISVTSVTSVITVIKIPAPKRRDCEPSASARLFFEPT